MYKILIVDDEFIIHKGIAGLLKRSVDYFDVYEASDGSEALELIAQENIDAMLLDAATYPVRECSTQLDTSALKNCLII